MLLSCYTRVANRMPVGAGCRLNLVEVRDIRDNSTTGLVEIIANKEVVCTLRDKVIKLCPEMSQNVPKCPES
jgi:hypothetical protein